MFQVKVVFLFILQILWRLSAWFFVPFLLLFAEKTKKKTSHYGQPTVTRYELPKWLKWAESPDELLPGGLYEPTVLKMYNRHGWFITSWYWIGLRNVGNGIVWGLGHEVPKAFKEMSPIEAGHHGIWRKNKIVLGLKFIWGWETVRDWHSTKTKDQGFWAVPHATIRLAKQD